MGPPVGVSGMRSWNDRVGIKAGDFTLFRLGKGAFYHLQGGVEVGRSSFVVGPPLLANRRFHSIADNPRLTGVVFPVVFIASLNQAIPRPPGCDGSGESTRRRA